MALLLRSVGTGCANNETKTITNHHLTALIFFWPVHLFEALCGQKRGQLLLGLLVSVKIIPLSTEQEFFTQERL
jgi:hypothetical protein